MYPIGSAHHGRHAPSSAAGVACRSARAYAAPLPLTRGASVETQLLHEMARKGIQPDTVVFNAAISACEKGQQWHTALRLMAQMRQMGLQPTAVTYGAAISACEKGKQWQKALALLAQMSEEKVSAARGKGQVALARTACGLAAFAHPRHRACLLGR